MLFPFQRLAFSFRTLILSTVEFLSFHHGGKKVSPVMESNFLHGGKNKYLLQFSLTVAAKRDKSGDAAA